jgi:hypothetical protein
METITTEVVDTGRKRDTQGRRIVTVAERTALMLAYQQSGLTQRVFAQREGIKLSTFTAWLQGRRRASEAGGAARVKFAEVRLPPRPLHGLEVRLPDGTIIRGGAAAEVAALLRALRT